MVAIQDSGGRGEVAAAATELLILGVLRLKYVARVDELAETSQTTEVH